MRHHEEKINLYEAPTNNKIMQIHLIDLIKVTEFIIIVMLSKIQCKSTPLKLVYDSYTGEYSARNKC